MFDEYLENQRLLWGMMEGIWIPEGATSHRFGPNHDIVFGLNSGEWYHSFLLSQTSNGIVN
jgi:hypothetical protein